MKSIATAVWDGGLKDGKGVVSAESGAFHSQVYTFAKRFEGQGVGTTPEELIAAAHAGCFSMALSAELGKAGFPPVKIATKVTVTLEPVDGKATVSTSAIEVAASVPGITDEQFQEIAAGAKAGCPVSRALTANITLSAKLS